MSFAKEPDFQHGQTPRTGVLLVNLGTPDEPTPKALRRYLGQFLWDPRVVEIPRAVWWLILHGIVLRVRPKKSAEKYASIWTPQGSPLRVWTEKQTTLLTGFLGQHGHQLRVRHAMRYGQPSVASQLDHFHDDADYIASLAESVREHWAREGRPDKLVMSFHGMPHRTLLLGDPYHCECMATGHLLAQALGLSKDQYIVTFQSRFGKAKWLQPYTEPTLRALAKAGTKRVDVICPAFVSDCIETLEEIDMEAREAFLSSGGQAFHYIPCLNDRLDWIRALSRIVEQHLRGWPTQLEQQPSAQALRERQERAKALGAKA